MSDTFRKKHQARQSADWMLDDDGSPMGLIGPDGKLYKVVTADENDVAGGIESIKIGSEEFGTVDVGASAQEVNQ